jgi:Tfp pilus assembly protein PilN
MTQVNLLPPEIRQRAIIRRNTFLVGAAGVGLIGLMVLLYLMQASNLAQVNDDIAAQETTNASLQDQANQLAGFATLKTQAEAKGAILKQVFANEVSMSSLMQDVSDIMPSDAFLTSMAVTTAAPGAEVPTASGLTTFVGQVTFAGNAYMVDTFPVWLDRIGGIKGFGNPYLGSYTESQAGTSLYQFQSGADLTQDILTLRGQRGSAALPVSAGVGG